jgi:hypothetical protein
MKASPKPLGFVALGVAIAAGGFIVWKQFLSRDAEINAVYDACIKEIADTGSRVKSGIDSTAGSISRGAGDSIGKWLDGVSGGMSDAVCGTIRDACTTDFDGRICSTARERYR